MIQINTSKKALCIRYSSTPYLGEMLLPTDSRRCDGVLLYLSLSFVHLL